MNQCILVAGDATYNLQQTLREALRDLDVAFDHIVVYNFREQDKLLFRNVKAVMEEVGLTETPVSRIVPDWQGERQRLEAIGRGDSGNQAGYLMNEEVVPTVDGIVIVEAKKERRNGMCQSLESLAAQHGVKLVHRFTNCPEKEADGWAEGTNPFA